MPLSSRILVVFRDDWGTSPVAGLIIDDAIVVVENIIMHRNSGQSRAEAVRSALSEITTPLVGSTLTPIVVFLPLPATGTTCNISSFMGLNMVAGIVAKNGILPLDAHQKFRRAGLTGEDAMIAAGERRLRPILMTALTTLAGMIPLALALGAGHRCCVLSPLL